MYIILYNVRDLTIKQTITISNQCTEIIVITGIILNQRNKLKIFYFLKIKIRLIKKKCKITLKNEHLKSQLHNVVCFKSNSVMKYKCKNKSLLNFRTTQKQNKIL